MSIRANGGAVRYWRHKWKSNAHRAVLCRNGKVLILWSGRWQEARAGLDYSKLVDGTVLNMLETNTEWENDTRPSMTAAITRTGREARRAQ